MTFSQPLFHCVREGLVVIHETCIPPSGDLVHDTWFVIAELDIEFDIVSLLTTWGFCAVNDYLAVADLANEIFITCHEISGSICRETALLNIAATSSIVSSLVSAEFALSKLSILYAFIINALCFIGQNISNKEDD